ncbi:hypothetical protein [Prevotella sp. E2-28]|uniref:hypothetical protein n=1 Tax=Prevotella sp. E2-28 TaxID=2913620 RepID=UPI001EDA128B|nr:hypothetical protein [Prevotella sp. E2-28]UKK52639.1 hypothetical protein L6465_08475 [Prevotella sp. E2-28]
MTTIKSYADLSQSKTLSKILSHESADFGWNVFVDGTSRILPINDWDLVKDGSGNVKFFHAWSLAALLEQLPYELCDDDGNSSYLQINKEDDVYQIVYTDPYGDFESIETDRYDDFVDACYEMILKLNKLNLL